MAGRLEFALRWQLLPVYISPITFALRRIVGYARASTRLSAIAFKRLVRDDAGAGG
jgi:hypothetical protein